MKIKWLLFLIVMFSFANMADAQWINGSYLTRFYTNISNENGLLGASVVNFSMDTQKYINQSNMKADCSDILFTYKNQSNGTETELIHHLYGGLGLFGGTTGMCNNMSTLFYINVPYPITNDNKTQIGVYFNFSNAPSKSLANSTYFVYDDFSRVEPSSSTKPNNSLWLWGTNFGWGNQSLFPEVGDGNCGVDNVSKYVVCEGGGSTNIELQPYVNFSGKKLTARIKGYVSGAALSVWSSDHALPNQGITEWDNWGASPFSAINDYALIEVWLNATEGRFINKTNNAVKSSRIQTGINYITFEAGNENQGFNATNVTVVSYFDKELNYIFNADEFRFPTLALNPSVLSGSGLVGNGISIDFNISNQNILSDLLLNATGVGCFTSQYANQVSFSPSTVNKTNGATITHGENLTVTIVGTFGANGIFSTTITCNSTTTGANQATATIDFSVSQTQAPPSSGGGGVGSIFVFQNQSIAQPTVTPPQINIISGYTNIFEATYKQFDEYMLKTDVLSPYPNFLILSVVGLFIYLTEKYKVMRRTIYGIRIEEKTRFYAKIVGLGSFLLIVTHFEQTTRVLGLTG